MLTVKQLAEMFQVNPMTIYRWVDKKKIPHERTPGGMIRFDDGDIKKWKKERSVDAVAVGQ